MSSTQFICPRCHTPLKAGTSEGLCPRCVLRGVVRSGKELNPDPHADDPLTTSPALGRLGDYELLSKIDQGGMGAVYRARQRTLNRLVALKLILAGRLATDQEVRRFRTEAEAAAQLDHPNIVPIYEIGEEDGRHFFAMKFVEGGSLAERSAEFLAAGARDESSPGTNDASARNAKLAQLLENVARAVHHAHQRGVLHRDLKPANILVDEHGAPHVTDFGLARFPERESGITLPGTVLGTPSFMAPEQAAGAARELTTAADVYSLGAILYFLMTGRAPFAGSSAAETLRRVLDEEPVRPRLLNRATDRDLETICLKCLEKDPQKRYPSALALAEDLERWREHEPIHARPATPLETARKWARRRPAAAALLGFVMVAVVAFVVTQVIHRHRLEGQRNRAVEQEEATRLNLYSADVFLAGQALGSGNLGLARRALEAHRPRPGQKDLRGFEWRHLWAQCQGDQIAVLTGHTGAVMCVAFSPDAQRVASGGDDRTVRLWNVSTHQPLQVLDGCSDTVTAVAFSPDGRQITAATADTAVSVREVETGRVIGGFLADGVQVSLAPFGEVAAVSLAVFPPTGRENAILLHDAKTGAMRGRLQDGTGRAAISHDGRMVAAATRVGFALWDEEEQLTRLEHRDGTAYEAFVFSEDDNQLAAFTGRGRAVRIWDVAAAALVAEFSVPETRLHSGAFSPDGRRLATCGTDQSIHLWDLGAKRKQGELKGHVNEVRAVAFSANGQWLASAGKDASVRLWHPTHVDPAVCPTNVFPPCALSPDGRWLAGQDRPGRSTNIQVMLWDTQTWQVTRMRHLSNAQPVAFLGAQGPLLAMTRPNQADLLLLERSDLRGAPAASPVRLPESDRPRTATDFSSSRGLFALGSYDGEILVWRADHGQLVSTLRGPTNEVVAVRFAPDGRTLASFTRHAGLRLWSVDDGREIRGRSMALGQTNGLAFAHDGRLLAATDTDNAIHLWETSTGATVGTLTGHAEPVLCLAFAPGDRTLASAGQDGMVKLWSVGTRRELATIFRGEAKVWLKFSADGRSLYGADASGQLNVWSAPEVP